MHNNTKLTPGSDRAVLEGCRCPVVDNSYGRGRETGRYSSPVFVVNESCPLHGEKKVAA